LITGATEAIAVPPHIAVPDANKYDCFFVTPKSFPKPMTTKKVTNTNPEIQGR